MNFKNHSRCQVQVHDHSKSKNILKVGAKFSVMYLYFSMYLLKVYKKFNMCFFIKHLNKEMAEEKAFILHTSAPSK